MKKRNEYYPPAQIALGEHLMQLRESRDVSRKALGKIVKMPEQQIAKYEAGAFVPISMLENITKTLGAQIPKKIIRQISAAREREKDGSEEQELLAELYAQAFED